MGPTDKLTWSDSSNDFMNSGFPVCASTTLISNLCRLSLGNDSFKNSSRLFPSLFGLGFSSEGSTPSNKKNCQLAWRTCPLKRKTFPIRQLNKLFRCIDCSRFEERVGCAAIINPICACTLRLYSHIDIRRKILSKNGIIMAHKSFQRQCKYWNNSLNYYVRKD